MSGKITVYVSTKLSLSLSLCKRLKSAAVLAAIGIAFSFSFLITQALASTTNGTISATDKWVWSENAGWIDFGTSSGNVHVTDSTLTGYAWSENMGWISLNCSNTDTCGDNNYAVVNDTEGTLYGFAFGENIGYIDFAPSGGGVSINSSGVFSGYAYGENVGWLVFVTDHSVTTDWRPASSRTSSSEETVVKRTQGQFKQSPQPFPNQTIPATPGSLTASTTPLGISFSINRQLWDRGEDIRALQKFFNTHGFILATDGVGSPGQETSIFGLLTYAALVRFQKANGIKPPAGYFGPITRAFINANY